MLSHHLMLQGQPAPGPIHYLYWPIGILIVWLIAVILRTPPALKTWHHHFRNVQLVTEDVYSRMAIELHNRNFPTVEVVVSKHFESGLFSPRRMYLTVDYKHYSIKICCMPFGTSSYISWFLHEAHDSLISRIPILRDIFGQNPKYKSYYQLDTATLFQAGVHDAVLCVIEEITEQHGLRPLTEREREPRIGWL